MPPEQLNPAILGLVNTVAGLGGDALSYQDVLSRIRDVTHGFLLKEGPKNILRIGIHAFASPLWSGTTTDMLSFLIQLKGTHGILWPAADGLDLRYSLMMTLLLPSFKSPFFG